MKPTFTGIALLLVTSSAVGSEMTTESEASHFAITAQGHLMFLNAKDSEEVASKPTYNLLHENSVSTEFKDFQGGIHFTNRWNPNGAREENTYFQLEKKRLSYTWSNGRVDLGDTHQELGKGIALSLYRDTAFGVDNTLEGVSLKQTVDSSNFGMMAGRINSFKNPVALNPVTNPLLNREVWLASAQASTRLDTVTLGGHYLFSLNRPLESQRFDKNWHTAGVNFQVDGLLDSIDLYGETNALVTQSLGTNQVSYPTGWGSYLSAAWSQENWRVKVEGKDYRKYYYDFRRPPTLEDDVVVTLNTQDVTAGRMALERKFGPKTAAYGSFLAGSDRVEKGELRHGIIGGKFLGPFRSAIDAKFGYRWVLGKSNLSHIGLKMKTPTFKGESIELEYRKQLANRDLNSYRIIEDRNQTYLSYNFSEQWNAGVGYEFVPTNPIDVQAHFFNANATYKAGSLSAKAFLGQTSGGTLCSAGVCRQVPPFSGAYLEGTYSF